MSVEVNLVEVDELFFVAWLVRWLQIMGVC